MNQIDPYLKAVAGGLRVPAEIRNQILEEMRQHFEDAKLEHLSLGQNEAEAERLAIRRLGDPQDLSQRFNHIHKTSLTAYVIDLFRTEKHRMRLLVLRTIDWSVILLIGLIAFVQVGLIDIFFMPRIASAYHSAATPMPSFVQTVTDASLLIFDWWLVPVLLIATAVTYVCTAQRLRPLREQLLKVGAGILSLVLVVWMMLSLLAVVISVSTLLNTRLVTAPATPPGQPGAAATSP